MKLIIPLDSNEATLPLVGGKGANLARMVRAGLPVPGGFLVTTHAYRAFVEANELQTFILSTLQSTRPDDPVALEAASKAIRTGFVAGTLPPELAEMLCREYVRMGRPPVAVRSSATAEDLPEMSFAGQQDTFLNVVSDEALLRATVNCWGSLWTARAIGYRARNKISHEDVALAVVVQEMVQSEASGVLFTVNPLNGKRTETVIDATLGLGEALVSGQVEPDHYVVESKTGRILHKTLGAKATVTQGQAGGGTITSTGDAAGQQAIPDETIVELAKMGQQVARYFGAPQDIEWAWANGCLYLVQSRPITALYPLPENLEPEPLRVLLSFGRLQGVLDPLTPLGQDAMRQIAANMGGVFGYPLTQETQQGLFVAGERLFVNITPLARHQRGRSLLRGALKVAAPGLVPVMESVLADPRLEAESGHIPFSLIRRVAPVILPITGRIIYSLMRPESARKQVQRKGEEIVDALRSRGATVTSLAGQLALFHAALEELHHFVLPQMVPGPAAGNGMLALLTGMTSNLPEGNHDTLEMTRGLPHNVTTEMDLALWVTARVIKADATAASYFAETDAATLAKDYLAGKLPDRGQMAVADFLQRYGMRGVAEIDLGRRRWREDPAQIMQMLQSYLRIESDGQAPDVMFARGAAAAEAAINHLAQSVRGTRGGWLKARLVKGAARRMRALSGLREAPKFFIVQLLGIVREGLLENGRELAEAGVLAQPDDMFFLHLSELEDLATGKTKEWQTLVAERRQIYTREKQRRQIPSLLLSDGQVFFGGVTAPAGTDDDIIVGSPVSPGVVEGVVHVVLDPHNAQLAPGEIMVCPGTDPGWTPLFLAIRGLVMEVGGMMTHGSVVAREYGIPAVVGVHQATTRLKTGQHIRVDGSNGEIVILDAVEDKE